MTPEEFYALRSRSATFRRLNPDPMAVDGPKPLKTHPGAKAPHSSKLSSRFELLWKLLDGPGLQEEYRFHAVRKFRYDYCHIPTHTVIDLEGAIWGMGKRCPTCKQGKRLGHSSGSGILRDIQKANAATLCGYKVFRLASDMITREHVEPIIEHIRKQEKFLGEHV